MWAIKSTTKLGHLNFFGNNGSSGLLPVFKQIIIISPCGAVSSSVLAAELCELRDAFWIRTPSGVRFANVLSRSAERLSVSSAVSLAVQKPFPLEPSACAPFALVLLLSDPKPLPRPKLRSFPSVFLQEPHGFKLAFECDGSRQSPPGGQPVGPRGSPRVWALSPLRAGDSKQTLWLLLLLGFPDVCIVLLGLSQKPHRLYHCFSFLFPFCCCDRILVRDRGAHRRCLLAGASCGSSPLFSLWCRHNLQLQRTWFLFVLRDPVSLLNVSFCLFVV